MSSWQRRMAAVDRRFSFHATISEHTADEPEPGAAGPVESPVPLAPAPPSPPPSVAARLAAMLREDQLAARHDRVVLAGTA